MARRKGSDRKTGNRTRARIGFFVLSLIFFLNAASGSAQAPTPTLSIATLTVTPTVLHLVTKDDMIRWVNNGRDKLGNRGLKADPYLMASAQDTAQIMADQNMYGHIGGVKDRIPLYGYNNGLAVFATENFMLGPTTVEAMATAWGDPTHQIIVENSLYCHIGVGIAEAADGTVYYVVQGAYPAFKNGCDYMKPPPGSTPLPGIPLTPNSLSGAPVSSVSQVIAAVRIATPNADGKTIHVVKNGQSLWSIAAAYGVRFDDLISWNHLTESSKLALDQELIIPDAETMARGSPPTAIPTFLATMCADGKFRHVIQPGETLWEIADLWKADLESLKRINGLNDDMALGVGWKLFVPVTPTATQLPTLTSTLTATPDREATIAAMVETASALTLTPAGISSPEGLPIRSGRPVGITLLLVGLGVFSAVGAGLIGYGLKRRR